MDKKERLLLLIEHYSDGNKSEFARKIGVSPQAISTWVSRNTFDIDLVYSNCENLSPEWLLTGEGEMLQEEEEKLPEAYPTDNPREGIPLIPLSAMAGAFTDEVSVLEYECERYVVPVFKGAEFLIPVKGDSMTPTYSSGDIVACKRIPMTDLFFQWNKPYILDTDQGPLLKRLQPGRDEKHVTIISDNERYTPFQLHLKHVRAVAIVIGTIRLE